MNNQFSDKYYLHVQQQNGDKSTGFALPRLATMDDAAEITEADLIKTDYHATMAARQGIFDAGYYDVNLYEFYDSKIIDSQHCIL